MRKIFNWTEKDRKNIKLYFQEKDGIKKLLELIPDKTYKSICRYANKMGLSKFKHNYKTLPENFWKEPNLTNSWLAGFFAADGNIADYQFYIGLAEKDLEYLKTIKEKLGWDGKIHIQKNMFSGGFINGREIIPRYRTVMIRLRKIPDKWRGDMENIWGLVPNKTLVLQPPKIENLELKLAYLSGMIDGDGWITTLRIKGRTTNGIHIGVVSGSPSVLEWMKDIFDKITPFDTKSKIIKRKKSYSYTITGRRAYFIGKMFLTLDIPRLDRKWDKLRNFIANVEDHSNTDYSYMRNLVKNYQPISV